MHTHSDTNLAHIVLAYPHGAVSTLCGLGSSRKILDDKGLWTDGPVTCLECLARDQ